ncbi:hypothetical protein IAR55_001983 [Kwoniella newhampshirensis]|uniref:NmrA-like domain-containing protein n=1 Tax=Kwoniella newhampshirensis TaxID=1651941 RepID=A0AAW0Z3T0_9TREE
MPRILVLGAGELGLAILEALSASNDGTSDLTVLLRPTSSALRQALLNHLSNLKVRTLYADLTAPDLHTHLRGYDIVISATGFAAGPGTQRSICQAVLKANVPWYIPWQFGVDYDLVGRGSSQPLFDEQLDVRDILRSQSTTHTKWTIVSTGIFTSFLFEPSFGVVAIVPKEEEKRPVVTVTALGKWENRITMTGAKDIGRVTAKIVLDSRERESGVVHIAGDTTTFDGLAIALEERGHTVKRKIKLVEELEIAIEKDEDDIISRYQLIWARNEGVAWDKEETWNVKNGVGMEDMWGWMEQNFLPV